jgi:hypothetical protein
VADALVCTENSIHVSESPTVGDDDRAVLPLPGPIHLAAQVNLKRTVLEQHNRWRRFASNYALLIEGKGSGLSLFKTFRPKIFTQFASVQMAIKL